MTGAAMLLKATLGIEIDPEQIARIVAGAEAAVPAILQFVEHARQTLDTINARLAVIESQQAELLRRGDGGDNGKRSVAGAGYAN